MIKGIEKSLVIPPQASSMLSFLCNDQRDWEEPGHLKFPTTLQEDTAGGGG